MSEFADELRAEIAQLEKQLSIDPRFVQLEKLRGWLAKYEAETAPKPKKGRGSAWPTWTPERRAKQSAQMKALRAGTYVKQTSPSAPSATTENSAAPKDLQDTIAATLTDNVLHNKPRVGPPNPRPAPNQAKSAAAIPVASALKDRERDAIGSFLEHRGATKLPPAHVRGSVDEKFSPLG